MINAKIKCPYCSAINPVDYRHHFCGCIACHQTIRIHKAEVIEAPKEEEILSTSQYDENGKKYRSIKGMAFCAMFLGAFGVDYFIYKKYAKGLVNLLLCVTGVSFVLGIFRFLDILALEPDELQEYYDKKGKF